MCLPRFMGNKLPVTVRSWFVDICFGSCYSYYPPLDFGSPPSLNPTILSSTPCNGFTYYHHLHCSAYSFSVLSKSMTSPSSSAPAVHRLYAHACAWRLPKNLILTRKQGRKEGIEEGREQPHLLFSIVCLPPILIAHQVSFKSPSGPPAHYIALS